MTPQRIELSRLLDQLEQGLISQGLYTPQRPDDKAFESTQPFFIDTMSFPCWLQYVLIEKFRLVVQINGPLPTPCHISEMAEMYAQGAHFPNELIQTLKEIDGCVNAEA